MHIPSVHVHIDYIHILYLIKTNCIWHMFLFKAIYIAFKVHILLVHAFPGNQTHDLGAVQKHFLDAHY